MILITIQLPKLLLCLALRISVMYLFPQSDKRGLIYIKYLTKPYLHDQSRTTNSGGFKVAASVSKNRIFM